MSLEDEAAIVAARRAAEEADTATRMRDAVARSQLEAAQFAALLQTRRIEPIRLGKWVAGTVVPCPGWLVKPFMQYRAGDYRGAATIDYGNPEQAGLAITVEGEARSYVIRYAQRLLSTELAAVPHEDLVEIAAVVLADKEYPVADRYRAPRTDLDKAQEKLVENRTIRIEQKEYEAVLANHTLMDAGPIGSGGMAEVLGRLRASNASPIELHYLDYSRPKRNLLGLKSRGYSVKKSMSGWLLGDITWPKAGRGLTAIVDGADRNGRIGYLVRVEPDPDNGGYVIGAEGTEHLSESGQRGASLLIRTLIEAL